MRLYEKISKTIQKDILSGKLKQGERLPAEVDLTKDFKVSRSVIREAMRLLEGLGLVKIKKGPKGGIFVDNGYHKPLSDSLKGLITSGQISEDNVFAIRLLIEPYVTSEAATNASQKDIEELKLLLQPPKYRMKDAIFLQRNRANFHLRLAKATGNPVLEVLMNSLIELLRDYFEYFKNLNFEIDALNSMEKIFEAIAEKKSKKAGKLMSDFILSIKHKVQELK